ncbi:MAG TPA: hypothetical protein VGE07_03025 [Herpetosiphonaceae bacterium]
MRRLIPVLALAAALAGCSGDNAGTANTATPQPTAPANAVAPAPAIEPPLVDPNPNANANIEVTEIPVDSIEVVVRESSPPQVAAQVKGTLGDGCAELKDIVQKRDGNTITITITSARPKDAMCTAIAKLFDQAINLDGEFAAGEYVVIVNGVEKSFKI